jgi:osmotically-inducible protein OsmY
MRVDVAVKQANLIAVGSKASSQVIREDIKLALKGYAEQPINGITIIVYGSEVTLFGCVQSSVVLDLVKTSARNSPGVKSVHNYITIF